MRLLKHQEAIPILELFEGKYRYADKCYFYKYKGPGPRSSGFPDYKEMNGTSCDDFSQFCRVYGNTTTGKPILLI